MNFEVGQFGYFEYTIRKINRTIKTYGTVIKIESEVIHIVDSAEPEIVYKPEITRITKFEKL